MSFEPVWGAPIAWYLFLAGLGGGAFITSAFLRWKHPEAHGMRFAGHVIAPVVVIIGLFLLMFDAEAGLHNPLRFALLLHNPCSVMTWGVVFLAAFVIIALVTLLLDCLKKQVPAWLEIIASETILYVFSFIPRMVHCLIFAMAVLAQYAAIAVARRNPLPAEIDIKSTSRGYFHFAQKNADSVRFLGIIAIGSFLMSIAIGFLKGFPDGDPIPFTRVTRLLYTLLIDGVFIGLLWGTIKGKKSTMTIGTWVVMQGLGSIALLLFALFPERLDIGAVFGNAMNVTMTGFILYLIIAFSSYGHRDTYYYAIAGWGVFIFPRSLVRVTSIALYAQFPSTSLPTALCGGLLLISAQFIFLQFLMLERDETAATKATAISVQRLLGIKDEAAPGTEMRKAIVRESAQEMQKQFMLSDRETEVLTLYAMGLTQAKIAEELCIAPGTAHTHVKRIYSKTDLHSRQALLDYIERYTD